MVKSRTPPRSSRDRLLAAAADEFAARGFDGARIDRIAAAARVNKAMIYYHFRSKAGIYHQVLIDLFSGVADSAEAVPASDATPEDQLRRFIEVIAERAVARPHFPPIWLREMAEAGRHIDRQVVAQLARVMAVLETILRAGRRTGRFRDAPVVVVHMGIVAPLLLFSASRTIRERFAGMVDSRISGLTTDAMVRHVQEVTLASLLVADTGAGTTPRMRPRQGRRTK